MKRRKFIQQSSLASGALFVPHFLKAVEKDGTALTGTSEKRLVIIQLSGGNDGLNTIIPYTNDIYYRSRPKIAIPSTDVLKVMDNLGFHTSLKPLMGLYDKGYLTILNNVGYPNPDRSHFRSTDIWHTASKSNEYLTTGWIGRYLEEYGKKAFTAIEVDDSLSLMLKGEHTNGIAVKNAKLLFNNVNTPYFKKILNKQTDQHLSEHNLGYLYKTMIEARSSAKYIYETSRTTQSKKDYPDNPFGKQLSTTAEFINSGLATKVYYVSMGGFDTHANQLGAQSRLLEIYSKAMAIFLDDLEQNGSLDDTIIMTFSEFGRRVGENASKGTDHGTANQVFIMGSQLKKAGFYNQGPDLLALDNNQDLTYTIDFRSVYATLLERWLDVPQENILRSSFTTLDFI